MNMQIKHCIQVKTGGVLVMMTVEKKIGFRLVAVVMSLESLIDMILVDIQVGVMIKSQNMK